jgi:hypothetical protein
MSNFLDRAMNETVELHSSDGGVQNVRALVQKGSILLSDTRLRVLEGDLVKRKLPSGITEEYDINTVTVNQGLRGEVLISN